MNAKKLFIIRDHSRSFAVSLLFFIKDKVPLYNRVFQFVVMKDIEQGKDYQQYKYNQKQKNIENQKESEENQRGKDYKEHHNEMNQTFMLEKAYLCKMMGIEVIIMFVPLDILFMLFDQLCNTFHDASILYVDKSN